MNAQALPFPAAGADAVDPLRAALARNASRAVQLMTDHIGRTNERVAKTLGASAAQPIKLRRVNGKV